MDLRISICLIIFIALASGVLLGSVVALLCHPDRSRKNIATCATLAGAGFAVVMSGYMAWALNVAGAF